MSGEDVTAVTVRRIEVSTSRTAQVLCMGRAFSYAERDPLLHSDDWVSAKLLPSYLRGHPAGRLAPAVGPVGCGQGHVRVGDRPDRYVDDVFRTEASTVGQVVILGAGYDARAIRFASELAAARLFEVDAPRPQADKVRRLQRRGLDVPRNLTFVPVDFEKETVSERLASAGFTPGLPTLYLLEGLTMYLTPEAIDVTFGWIAGSAGHGSVLVFDHAYACVLRGDQSAYGAQGVTAKLAEVGQDRRAVEGSVWMRTRPSPSCGATASHSSIRPHRPNSSAATSPMPRADCTAGSTAPRGW